MARSLIVFSLAAVVLATLSMPFMALFPGEIILGGQHHITAETPLDKNVSFYFAQVTVDEGAQVDGHIFLCSSTLDLGGNVTNGIHAIESDLTVRNTAHIEGKIDQTDFIHWTLLLPAIARVP